MMCLENGSFWSIHLDCSELIFIKLGFDLSKEHVCPDVRRREKRMRRLVSYTGLIHSSIRMSYLNCSAMDRT